jgi:protoheme IX farnesyltransferase
MDERSARETNAPASCVPCRLSVYARLSKGSLVVMVALTAAAGFLLAGRHLLDLPRLLWLMIGTALIAAGANAFNQCWEVQADALMQRTRGRPLPALQIGRTCAFLWAASASVAGVLVLACGTNWLAASLGLSAEAIYLLAYTPLKKRSPLCTLVGAVCGAIPPLMGWAAASGEIGYGAWLLAALLFVWQIPHSLALAWLHRADMARAGFRVLPAADAAGRSTAEFCLLYSLALVPLSLCLGLTQGAGWPGTACAAAASLAMAWLSVRLYHGRTEARARALFVYSLVYLPVLLVLGCGFSILY